MSYNWQSTATAKGRDRLKEGTNKGIIIARMAFAPDEIGQCHWMDMFRLNLCGEVVRNWEEAEAPNYTDDGKSILDCIEFLDPEPPQPQPDENGLLPCPFCGDKAFLSYEDGSEKTCVTCGGCGTMSALFTDEDNAIEMWNRREGCVR